MTRNGFLLKSFSSKLPLSSSESAQWHYIAVGGWQFSTEYIQGVSATLGERVLLSPTSQGIRTMAWQPMEINPEVRQSL